MERIDTTVSQAITVENTRRAEEEQRRQQERKVSQALRDETVAKQSRIDELQREMSRMEKAYERELERANLLLAETRVTRVKEFTSRSTPELTEQKDDRSWLRRHTTLITGSAVSLVVLLLVISIYLWQRQTG